MTTNQTDNDPSPQAITFEAILPPVMALRAEQAGIRRVAMDPVTTFALSILAGAFISFGAILATTVGSGGINVAGNETSLSASLPYGLIRLITGIVFSAGLLMVVIAGAELFTGNNMIVMAWANGKISSRAVLRNWTVVFIGNCVGALATAGIMFFTKQYQFGNGAVGLNALLIADSKTSLETGQALFLGMMCNTLVCLAVWMCYSARTTVDRAICIVPPIATFVASGFEHSIANVYFIPVALFIKAGAPDSFWTNIRRTPADFSTLTWDAFLYRNLLPVTVGNVIGGTVLVAAAYWFIYLRKGVAR